MHYKVNKCRTPWCKDSVSVQVGNINVKKFYCTNCNDSHEKQILELQYLHNKPIREVLVDEAKLFNFKSLSILADAFESSIPCVRKWITKYFGISWDEFRREYHCKGSACLRFNTDTVRNKYYIRAKIKKERICACLTENGKLLVKPKGASTSIFVEELLEKFKDRHVDVLDDRTVPILEVKNQIDLITKNNNQYSTEQVVNAIHNYLDKQ